MKLNQAPLEPFNITILDPDSYIKRKGCLPVSTTAIFESSSTKFHPDGFFSEVIFGQVGSTDRLIKRGYIDLRTKIITPHMYKQVMALKSCYRKILSGTAYAVFDPDTSDLVLADANDPNAHTGFSWFCSMLPLLKFAESSSIKRKIKIGLVEKYRDNLLVDKFIVLPAGVRDIRFTDKGKVTPEEINTLYSSLLSLTMALPEKTNDDPIFDTIRLQIQNKALEIYEYIAALIEGKHGFAQGKLVSRSVAYGSRNVITAPPMSKVTSPNSPQAFNVDEIMLPLFQAMKSAMPLMVNKLKEIFFNQIFQDTSGTISAIDPDTLELTYIDVSLRELNKFTTTDGINKLMNEFRNPHNHFKPVTVRGKRHDGKGGDKDYWLYLMHDTGDSDIYCFRSTYDFKQHADTVHTPSPNAAALEAVKSLGVDPMSFMVSGAGGAALLLGGKHNIHCEFEFIAKDEATANALREAIQAKSEDSLFTNASVVVESGVSYSPVSVDGIQVLSIADIHSRFTSSGTVKAKYNLLVQLLNEKALDTKHIRAMTWVELFYIAGYAGLLGKYTTATRHPVLVLSNITLNKIKLMSTNTSRIAYMRFLNSNSDVAIPFPQYPVMTSTVKGSMSVFPAHLEKYDGDHDGDVLGIHILFSDQSTKEVTDYFEDSISMVDASHTLEYGLSSGRLCRFTMMAATYREIPQPA